MDYDRLRDLQKKFNENPRRYFVPLANEYRKGGQAKRATEICRAQLAQMPGHMSGQIVYGQSLHECGELDEARQVFERALTLDPENLIALRSLGDMSLQSGNTVDARKWYTRLLGADPKDAAVIALVSGIDAAADAAPVPTPQEIPGIDADAGDQAIPPIMDLDEEEVDDEQLDDEQLDHEDLEDEVVGAQSAPPAGLERHYPSDPTEEALPEEGTGAEGLTGTAPPQALAGATSSISDDEDAIDTWTPPPGATVHERIESRKEDRMFPRSGAEPFVNETMAQLYLQQGYRQLALRVYYQLAESRPDDQVLKDRIAEIEAADHAAHSKPVAPAESAPPPAAARADSPQPAPPAESAPPPAAARADFPPPPPPPQAPLPREAAVANVRQVPVYDTPPAESASIAARQPSVREFFATLGRRRPPLAAGTPGGSARTTGNSLPTDTGAPLGSSAPSASLDAVFAGATVSQADSRAASRLAGAFSGAAGAPRASPPTPPMPTPRLNTQLPQAQESEEDVAKFRAWLDGLTGE